MTHERDDLGSRFDAALHALRKHIGNSDPLQLEYAVRKRCESR